MSVTFSNWNSRAAIAVVAEERRLFAGSKWFADGTLPWLNLNGHDQQHLLNSQDQQHVLQ